MPQLRYPLAAVSAVAILVSIAPSASPRTETSPTEPAAVARGLESIVSDDVMRSVQTLTQDDWEGRLAGHPGCKKAGDWIGKRFEQLGLEAIGDNDTHFQVFNFQRRNDRRRRPGDDDKKKRQPKRPVSKPHSTTPTSRNVVGLLRGTDPKLRDEVVVVGAHYDHVGRVGQWNAGQRGGADGADDTFNGADDNASGTSALLEIAEAFVSAKVKTRRSVLFLCFSAEEHGLLGSKWYCDHPIVPLDKTVAMINLDMVGHKHKKPFDVVGVAHASGGVLRTAVQNAMKRVPGFKAELGDWAKRGDSDHASFIKARVPAMFFFSGMHKVYHTVNDEPRTISGRRIERVSRVVFLTTVELANLKKTPTYVHWDGSGDQGGSLGISGQALSRAALRKHRLRSRNGGILVRDVRPGSLAAKAGVKAKDIVIAVGGIKITRGREFDRVDAGVKRAKPGRVFRIKIIRGESRKTLKVTVPK